MKMKVYTVFDRAAGLYSQPMFVLNESIMLRILRNCLNNPEHNYALNPEDYILFDLGEYDDNTAQIVGELKKVTALNAMLPKNQLEEVK